MDILFRQALAERLAAEAALPGSPMRSHTTKLDTREMALVALGLVLVEGKYGKLLNPVLKTSLYELGNRLGAEVLA